MDLKTFHECTIQMVNYVTDYFKIVKSIPVSHAVKPFYLREFLPEEAPLKPANFAQILEDFERKIIPGITHWQHPKFHGYFPSGNSHVSVLADFLSGLLGVQGFSWEASPSCTELELIVLDWLAKAMGLPEDFLFHADMSQGGGVIQNSSSEAILVCMLAARAQALKDLRIKFPEKDDGAHLIKLVAYTSEEASACVEKAAVICMVKLRKLESDSKCELQGHQLQKIISEDIMFGLIPFFVCATLGTMACASSDNLDSLGLVAKRQNLVWFHVDASYAGNALICPEFRTLLKGVDNVDSFNMNPYMWMNVTYDCACLWVKDRLNLQEGLVGDPLDIMHKHPDQAVDYRHWSISVSRRMRSLKIWFTLMYHGIEALQAHIRNHCKLAKYFEGLVKSDVRFEVTNDVRCGLVCFRMREQEQTTRELLDQCNSSGEIFMTPALVKGQYVIRFSVNAPYLTESDMDTSWSIILKYTDVAIAQQANRHVISEKVAVDNEPFKITPAPSE
uniref:Aromatic-L-amino-acid decarboxylase n=1 Tax=Timema shepardi TaxID=629360 RepID=A0A7R9AN84_TIMSH|nr:unnamed protein product [Timema shepardi]